MKLYHFLQKGTRKAIQGFQVVAMTLMILALIAGYSLNASDMAKSQVKKAAAQAVALVPDDQLNIYEVTRETYTDRAITIHFPRISKMIDAEKQSRLNQILKIEALSVLQDYEKVDLEKLTVKLDFVIGRQNSELLSVQFSGSRFLEGTPYSTALFHSVNLDMLAGRKLRLQDIVQIDDKFLQVVKKGRMNAAEGVTFANLKLDNNKLIKAFGQADSALSDENPERAFSYFTKDGMGISFSVIHALGDHVEFEFSIRNLTEFATIKPEEAHLLSVRRYRCLPY